MIRVRSLVIAALLIVVALSVLAIGTVSVVAAAPDCTSTCWTSPSAR